MTASTAWIVVLWALATSACDRGAYRVASELTGGDPDKGRHDIAKYGCDTCMNLDRHDIASSAVLVVQAAGRTQ